MGQTQKVHSILETIHQANMVKQKEEKLQTTANN